MSDPAAQPSSSRVNTEKLISRHSPVPVKYPSIWYRFMRSREQWPIIDEWNLTRHTWGLGLRTKNLECDTQAIGASKYFTGVRLAEPVRNIGG